MKKNSVRNFSQSLISASLKGLAVFLVFGVSLYAYAVTYPPNQPNAVSGVVGLYVGQTAGSWDGNRGGYEPANALCAGGGGALENSHICSPMEMGNTYNHDPTALAGLSESLWVNNGAPAYFGSISNDCQGWTTNTTLFGNSVFGSVWSKNGYGSITTCSNARAFACCK